MSTTVTAVAEPMDIRTLHERMGRVYHQPVRVHSFTNKRFTVNFRVPLEQLRRVVPPAVELDEIRDTGLGMFSLCTCDFWVSRFGWLPIPPVRNNDMLCRFSTKIRKGSKVSRAYYTLRSDSSSQFLGFFGKRFSHFRKQVSPFMRVDVMALHVEDELVTFKRRGRDLPIERSLLGELKERPAAAYAAFIASKVEAAPQAEIKKNAGAPPRNAWRCPWRPHAPDAAPAGAPTPAVWTRIRRWSWYPA
ncbi:MAG: hypothetical protein ACREYE_24475 [Gammaproteobacteria bacterium]